MWHFLLSQYHLSHLEVYHSPPSERRLVEMGDQSISARERLLGRLYLHSTLQRGASSSRPINSCLLFAFSCCHLPMTGGASSLATRSSCDVRRRWQRVRERLPRCPSSVGSSRGLSFRTLPVALRRKIVTSRLSAARMPLEVSRDGATSVIIDSPPLEMGA